MQKKIVFYLFILYGLFILYNTLLPFDFHNGIHRFQERVGHIQWTPYFTSEGRVSLTDVAGNIILFLPFGFLLYMFLSYKKIRHPILYCIVAGASLSFLIEFLQLFISKRNTAPHDVINNALGTWMGAVAAAFYARKVSAVSRRLFYELFNEKPFFLIVAIVGIAQAIWALMPFTVSVSYSSVVKSIKATNFIPFSYQSVGKLFLNAPNKNDLLPFDKMMFIADILFWIVIGYLIMLSYRLYWKGNNRVKTLMFFGPFIYFSLLEFMQMFIVSRTTDINDIISGCAGVFSGYLLFGLIQGGNKEAIRSNNLDLLKIPVFLYLLFILFAGLQPFDWSLAAEVLQKDFKWDHMVPFYAYFRKSSLWNIFDLIDTILYFMPISLFWSYKLREKGMAYTSIYFRTILTGFLLGFLIELSQLFSPSRVADITDLLSYTIGGGLGTFLIYYFEQEIRPRLQRDRYGEPVEKKLHEEQKLPAGKN